MTTKTDDYKAIVRFKGNTKGQYTINKAAGTVEDAVKTLMVEIPNCRVGLVLVPPAEHFVEPEAA